MVTFTQSRGSCPLPDSLAPGLYELRLFAGESGARVALSNLLTVPNGS